jgi:mono/diheme cytochrome c family protein
MMNNIITKALMTCILTGIPFQFALAQKGIADFGKQEFESRCASCHGKDGKGSGWLSYFLNVQTPDLTTLAQKNGGILPIDRLYQNISGEGVLIHGPSDMPAWGKTYKQEAPDIYLGVPYNSEMYSRGRILLLIEYINRLQIK